MNPMESSIQKLAPRAGSPVTALCPEPLTDPVPGTQNAATTSARPLQKYRLVYLLSIFPAISHTFFLNEVTELRRQGFDVEVASINQPNISSSSMSETEAEETEKTFYIKSSGTARAIWTVTKTFLCRPGAFARGLSAALRLGRWDLHATLYALFYLAEALILGDWMRTQGRRHLHIHFCGPVATVGMLASIAWRFPFSLTVHGPDEFYDVEKLYLRQKVQSAKFIFCISDFCRSQLMRLVDPIHWEKMHVVRQGVNLDLFRPTRHEREADKVREVLCVGRLVASKGQLILLRACELLLKRGYSFRVRLVGTGPDREHLQAFAVERNIPVIFEGAKNNYEVRQLLDRADVFALASFAEGVPVALMEAMAMEVPCVSTSVAGIPELIRNGLDGLLVPASSVEAMASALGCLLDDPVLRRRLGVAGRTRVEEDYNLAENVNSLANMFRELVSKST
jgi:colanic acid/amylovoran biosynthesis glycosyltransferase